MYICIHIYIYTYIHIYLYSCSYTYYEVWSRGTAIFQTAASKARRRPEFSAILPVFCVNLPCKPRGHGYRVPGPQSAFEQMHKPSKRSQGGTDSTCLGSPTAILNVTLTTYRLHTGCTYMALVSSLNVGRCPGQLRSERWDSIILWGSSGSCSSMAPQPLVS